jgi:hypothetical protein
MVGFPLDSSQAHILEEVLRGEFLLTGGSTDCQFLANRGFVPTSVVAAEESVLVPT